MRPFALCLWGYTLLSLSACDLWTGSSARLDASGEVAGESVAVDGDVVVIGAPGSSEATVFEARGGSFTRTEVLRPSAPQTDYPAYGQSVDVRGDLVIVGAPDFVTPQPSKPGRIYVYECSAGDCPEAAVLRSGTDQTPQRLGRAINFGRKAVTDGASIAAVGGVCDPAPAGPVCGTVEVFERVGGTWTRTAALTNPADPPLNGFGGSLAIDGDRLSAAARESNVLNTVAVPARIYTFRRSGGAWAVEGYAEAPPSATRGFGGGDVAGLEGDVLAVLDRGAGTHGAVYVFEWDGATWGLAARLTEPNLGGLTSYGLDLDLADGRLIVAAPGRVVGGESRGAAFVYSKDGSGTWAREAELPAPSGSRGFARSVSISGDRAVVGWTDAGSGRGGAYVFERRGSAWALAE